MESPLYLAVSCWLECSVDRWDQESRWVPTKSSPGSGSVPLWQYLHVGWDLSLDRLFVWNHCLLQTILGGEP